MQPNPKAIAEALEGYISFLKDFGNHDMDVAHLEKFVTRLRGERFTKKLLQEMLAIRDPVHSRLTLEFLEGRCLPNKSSNETEKEYYRILKPLGEAIYPPEPKPVKIDISSFIGSENVEDKVVEYIGASDIVRFIVEGSIELVRRYTGAICKADFDTAYSMTAKSFRESTSLKKFVSTHKKAAEQYGGSALKFSIEHFGTISASSVTSQRNAILVGFWIRNEVEQTGCWGSFDIIEEEKILRIAKFKFFTQ